jgi:hypothetical protein
MGEHSVRARLTSEHKDTQADRFGSWLLNPQSASFCGDPESVYGEHDLSPKILQDMRRQISYSAPNRASVIKNLFDRMQPDTAGARIQPALAVR